jgi:hypothetical protein
MKGQKSVVRNQKLRGEIVKREINSQNKIKNQNKSLLD